MHLGTSETITFVYLKSESVRKEVQKYVRKLEHKLRQHVNFLNNTNIVRRLKTSKPLELTSVLS